MIRIYLRTDQVIWNPVESYRMYSTGPYLPKEEIMKWLKESCNGLWHYAIQYYNDVERELRRNEHEYNFGFWGQPYIEFTDKNIALTFKLSN